MTTYRNEPDGGLVETALPETGEPTVGRDRRIAPPGDTTRWLYDDATGLVTNKLYADGKGPSYDYTPDGKLSRRTWARGVVTTYAYDGWGNLTNTTYSDDTPTATLAYDALGRQTEAYDAAGVTTFAYDAYGANTNETVIGVAGTNTIGRFYDDYGRDAGYALNGVRQTTLGYDEHTGRLATMSVPAREDEPHHSTTTTSNYNSFAWTYLQGSDLKQSLTYPNGLTASWQYDANNQLLQVRNALPTNVISQFDYTYDAAGRRIACAHSGTAFTQPDDLAYAYNVRSELTNAVAEVDSHYRYSYDFDLIGNRIASCERGTNTTYAANELNQYTQIDEGNSAISAPPRETFNPEFDADGNQTLVKTATGIWRVTYNGENRPVLWENLAAESNNSSSVDLAEEDRTILSMTYDRMGRRVTKNVECGVQSAECSCCIYNGYLQVYNSHSPTPTLNSNSYIWDPTEPIATRPLAWHNSALDTPHSALYYTHDGNKNVSEVISSSGDLAAHYDYAPFGAEIAQRGESAATNPWRFSSEFADDELGCDYYNYREYEPVTGRWMSRDMIATRGCLNLFSYCNNNVWCVDVLGLECDSCATETTGFPSGDDFYGRYCGARRINGRIYPNGQLGLRVDDIGTVDSKDVYDECCKLHDLCLSRIQNGCWKSQSEKNLATKDCDMRISLCWVRAQVKDKNLSVSARLRVLVAIPVMPILAHPTSLFPIEHRDGSVSIGFIGITF